MATGLLQDSIQQSLDMVVTDGFLNNAAVRKELDQEYRTLMKKSNPVNVIFKDKAYFDAQNLIIDLLAAQVSNNEKAIFEQIKKALSTIDVTVSKRLEKLKNLITKIIMTTITMMMMMLMVMIMMEMVTFVVYRLCLRFCQKIMNSIVNLILMMKN